MGRAILPELVIVLGLLVLTGLVLVGIAASQWIAGSAVTQQIRDTRRRRSAEREQQARQVARWEQRTRYQHGYAVVDVVRIARWDGKEAVVEVDDEPPAVVPEEAALAVTQAQIQAGLRAEKRNI